MAMVKRRYYLYSNQRRSHRIAIPTPESWPLLPTARDHRIPDQSAYRGVFSSVSVYAGNDITMPAMATDKVDMLQSIGNDNARYKIERAHLQATGKRVLGMILELR